MLKTKIKFGRRRIAAALLLVIQKYSDDFMKFYKQGFWCILQWL